MLHVHRDCKFQRKFIEELAQLAWASTKAFFVSTQPQLNNVWKHNTVSQHPELLEILQRVQILKEFFEEP